MSRKLTVGLYANSHAAVAAQGDSRTAVSLCGNGSKRPAWQQMGLEGESIFTYMAGGSC